MAYILSSKCVQNMDFKLNDAIRSVLLKYQAELLNSNLCVTANRIGR